MLLGDIDGRGVMKVWTIVAAAAVALRADADTVKRALLIVVLTLVLVTPASAALKWRLVMFEDSQRIDGSPGGGVAITYADIYSPRAIGVRFIGKTLYVGSVSLGCSLRQTQKWRAPVSGRIYRVVTWPHVERYGKCHVSAGITGVGLVRVEIYRKGGHT